MEQTTRLREFSYKLLIFVMYGENDVPFVRRQENRFIVETKPLSKRFEKSIAVLRQAFHALERAGYIYNLSLECGRARFYINIPKYLSFNALAPTMERHVAEMRVPRGGIG